MDSTEKKFKNRVLMGQIGAAHGIQGQVRIKSHTDDPLALKKYSPFSTNRPGLEITINKARLNKTVIVASISGVADRTTAETLNGVKLYVNRDQLPETTNEDEFYQADLIGLEVKLENGDKYGTVTAIQNHGAGDVLEIRPILGPSELYMFTKRIIPEINVAEGFVTFIPPTEIEVDEEEAFEAE
ncbi:ribosome maturation factor RimM [Maritalea sp.]|jgi:16S rRNA processing protein RimM|uniref:ribosome maturation factor RimM n=1 Tax=Maritalea sp. TaxID=2003361 RepID=UPI0039E5FAAA